MGYINNEMVKWFSLTLEIIKLHILEMILMEWKCKHYFIMKYNEYNYKWNNLLCN